jgi:hypothetical protein
MLRHEPESPKHHKTPAQVASSLMVANGHFDHDEMNGNHDEHGNTVVSVVQC